MPVSILKALDIIYEKTSVLNAELLPIELTLGRVMYEDSIATFDLPRFKNSAMDGYAVKCCDAGTRIPSKSIIYAGDNPSICLENHSAIKIMTGAPIPEGTEAVVPVENVTVHGQDISLPKNIQKDSNIRYAGEDVKAGNIYLHKGDKVTAYSIALLASQGVTHLKVIRKIKVAVFGTGDELRPHFEKIEAHQLYNSNTPMFLARSLELGCEVQYINASGDNIVSLENCIKQALFADIILTSGGVSMGDKDFTKDAFLNLGMTLHFDKIDIKPGKPTAFGTLGKTMVINLAGNPLASMVNYELFVRALIRKMSGQKAYYHASLHTKIKEDFSLRAGKYTVRLGYFDGKTFTAFKKQLPGMLSPLEKANAMLLTVPKIESIKKEAHINILPISWELTSSKKENFFNT